jgi:hypothetical protein
MNGVCESSLHAEPSAVCAGWIVLDWTAHSGEARQVASGIVAIASGIVTLLGAAAGHRESSGVPKPNEVRGMPRPQTAYISFYP